MIRDLTSANFYKNNLLVYKNNLLVIGETAGTTYSFTGEEIGKAMESAIIAAETIMENGNIEHTGIFCQMNQKD